MDKIILVIIIAVLVIGGVVVVDELTGGPREGVYYDAGGAFEIDYPDDWHVITSTILAGDVIANGTLTESDIVSGSWGDDDCFIAFSESNNRNELDLDDYIYSISRISCYELIKTKLGKNDFARKIGCEDLDGVKIVDYSYIAVNSKYQLLNFRVGNSRNDECHNKAKEILSSVKLD